MPLRFTETFWNENGRNLRKPDLLCLRQDAALYKLSLLQVRGDLEYNNTGIWFSDSAEAEQKFIRFLELSVAQNAQLALCPEYSCPWSIIDQMLVQDLLPIEGNLFILGCQSISPPILADFIQSHAQITWIYDDVLLQQSLNTPDRFFDPACIILKTRNANDQISNVIIVQFKTMFFGGEGFEWEQQNLILGQTFYTISNEFASTKLITLLCSDTLQNIDFNTIENGLFFNSPLLVVHLQLNQKPFQNNYKNYRNLIFAKGDKNWDKEVICLNWARGVTVPDKEGNWNEYGGSGFYIKTDKLNSKDIRINDNHTKGLYYTNWLDKRSYIYFLNYNESIFIVRTTKPSQRNADPTQLIRSGPELLELFEWENNNWQNEPRANDGFEALCVGFEAAYGDISCIKNSQRHVDVERIVALSGGNLINKEEWYFLDHLLSFRIGDTEINNRTNFDQDPDEGTKTNRKQRVKYYAYLKHSILSKPENLPDPLKDVTLRFDLELPKPERFLLNLHSNVSGHKGTGIFLGIATPGEAQAIKRMIQGFFKNGQEGKLVIVWYYHDNALQKDFSSEMKPDYKENIEKSPNSFRSTKES